MAKNLVKWFKKTVRNVVDPQRQERVSAIAEHLYRNLQQHRKTFDLKVSLGAGDLADNEVIEAKEAVFTRILDRVWDDNIVTEKELRTIKWVQQALELDDKNAGRIREQYAKERFQVGLAKAMEDGVLDDEEIAHLNHIAATMNRTMGAFARQFFRTEGEGFVRGMFLASVEGEALSTDDWNNLVDTSASLGLEKSELQKLIAKPAEQHLEHVLADAKSDGVISKVEEKELNRLIEMLQVRPKFKEYLRGEIGMLRQRQKILEGNLPSIPQPPELEIKAGELIHASCDGLLLVTRKLKSGPVVDEHRGTLTVLDSRAIFQSPEFSKAISYRRLVSCSGKEWCLEFQLDGKPQWSFTIHDVQPLFHLIFTQAIKMANQTAVRKNTSGPSRHISRDVRQRVWQRYGGQCAECGRADYLEFDHIIPVAKGGSNGDSNIQLLCRRCNLKKSDHI